MGNRWECSAGPNSCQDKEGCGECSLNQSCLFCGNRDGELCRSCGNREKLMELKKERLRSYREKKAMQDMIGDELEKDGKGNLEWLEKKREAYRESCREIIAEIERLEDGEGKEVLFLRYVQGKKWKEICARLSVSWNKAHYVHRRALEAYKFGDG